MIRAFKLMFWFLFIPLLKMIPANPKEFLKNPKNKDIIYPDETLYSA